MEKKKFNNMEFIRVNGVLSLFYLFKEIDKER